MKTKKVLPKSVPSHDARPEVVALVKKIARSLKGLKEIQKRCEDHWGAEDRIYRYYHGSFKVFWLQDLTNEIVVGLRALKRSGKLNDKFMEIVKDGTGNAFGPDTNSTWSKSTRPIVEAYFHARYFLDMTIKYGEEFAGKDPPNCLPSGWASVLYLYGLR